MEKYIYQIFVSFNLGFISKPLNVIVNSFCLFPYAWVPTYMNLEEKQLCLTHTM